MHLVNLVLASSLHLTNTIAFRLMSSSGSSSYSGVNDTTTSSSHATLSNMLSPVVPSSYSSPMQSATSPRLMPTKSRPTTALVFDQHAQQQQQQDTESLSSDEFALSSSATSKDNLHSKREIAATIQTSTRTLSDMSRLPQELAPSRRLSGLNQDVNSDSSDEADDRLTDTESQQDCDHDRTGTPVIAGHVQAHPATMDHGSVTALQSLREIDEHDKDGRRTHGVENRFRAMDLSSDQDQNSEAGDVSDPHPEASLNAGQIQGMC